MGIKDFHQHTKHYIEKVNISKYRGQRVGCDASAWLHKGASPHSWELYFQGPEYWQKQGQEPPWVTYGMKMVFMLRNAGLEPVVVFDGCRNPAKDPTSQAREQRRQEAHRRAKNALQANNEEDARKAIMQTVDITPDMAYDLMVALQARNVQFIVAPYEADAQLAFLASLPPEQGGVSAVLTEDSDLVAYGCNNLLFKCDVKSAGAADELLVPNMLIDRRSEVAQRAAKADEKGAKAAAKLVSFQNWTKDMVLVMSVLAGCDFLDSLYGFGFKTAHGFVQQGRTLEGTLRIMREHKRWKALVTNTYASAARKAREAFLYALVYDPRVGQTRRLHDLPAALGALSAEEIRHIGPEFEEPGMAVAIAQGRLNPRTFQPFAVRVPLPMRPAAPPLQQQQQQSQGPGSWMTANRAPSMHDEARKQLFGFSNGGAGASRPTAGGGAAWQGHNRGTVPANAAPAAAAVSAPERPSAMNQVQDIMQMYAGPSVNTAPLQEQQQWRSREGGNAGVINGGSRHVQAPAATPLHRLATTSAPVGVYSNANPFARPPQQQQQQTHCPAPHPPQPDHHTRIRLPSKPPQSQEHSISLSALLNGSFGPNSQQPTQQPPFREQRRPHIKLPSVAPASLPSESLASLLNSSTSADPIRSATTIGAPGAPAQPRRFYYDSRDGQMGTIQSHVGDKSMGTASNAENRTDEGEQEATSPLKPERPRGRDSEWAGHHRNIHREPFGRGNGGGDVVGRRLDANQQQRGYEGAAGAAAEYQPPQPQPGPWKTKKKVAAAAPVSNHSGGSSGSSSGKRKSSGSAGSGGSTSSGSQDRGVKRVAKQLSVAAVNCARISSFLIPTTKKE